MRPYIIYYRKIGASKIDFRLFVLYNGRSRVIGLTVTIIVIFARFEDIL